jgi:hypothetical protein
MDSLPVARDLRQESMIRFDQARIASVLGQRERAIGLLRQARLRGVLWEFLHGTSDFDSLLDDPFIASLLRPGR